MKTERITIYIQGHHVEHYEVGKALDNTRMVEKIVVAGQDAKTDFVVIELSDGERILFSGLPYVYTTKV